MRLGQYAGYRAEPNVAEDSTTETFAVIRAYLDLPRWQGVPFIIATGKRLAKHDTQVRITFRQLDPNSPKNALVIKIQPTEGVELYFNIKTPGKANGITEAKLDFCQSCSDVNRLNTPEAYEWMLEAIMNKEHFWFSEWEQIETSWRFIDKLREAYQLQNQPLMFYPPGQELETLIADFQ
ncbi:Glucose-6-phosphate 1-dehydrogenase [bioreactor metagenome]|uniref:Glucose-6-phosphate 1-dehydrogenase n=1 Tax=bioreactor metagenome TaxID=1076179 RepID=A0A645FM81_9ZZZZ